jgi:hypothetical protein
LTIKSRRNNGKVYELNKKYNKIVEDNEDVSRNINWKLVDFEFDNLFNYGDGNKVNFEELVES